ncbi:flp-15 [Pristionchus pacificus]|uniref:Flp-15 n=1 Tax=Pristionchus pacificus TaxID=54126 RepID=A0A2A6BPT0_PRIPA|nr:flp-15 [Pristionchus pacificus]|eukprot:PDM67783.1 flp-15 [Pristionchus pacificus]
MFSLTRLVALLVILTALAAAQFDDGAIEYAMPYVKKARPQGPMRFGKRRFGPSGPMRFGKRSAMVPFDYFYDGEAEQ